MVNKLKEKILRSPLEKAPTSADTHVLEALQHYWASVGLRQSSFAAVSLEQFAISAMDDYKFTVWANGQRLLQAHIQASDVWVYFLFPPNNDRDIERILEQAALQNPRPVLYITYHFDEGNERIIDYIFTS